MLATDSLDRLFDEAKDQAAIPLWTMMDRMVTPFPHPRAVPHLWSYEKMRPLLFRAGELVTAAEAERRVFQLINPAMAAPHTTDTIYAGLQLIKPGEVARAHRHIAFALRFIIEGDAAFTAVGGEKVTMDRGDLILTPSWNFHDHGHEGSTPMIWLDGLDLPFYHNVPVNFAQPYVTEQYPSEPARGASVLKYPWADMQRTLDAQPGSFARAEYQHRDHGGAIGRIMGAAAERIAGGASSPPRRETASSIYHVYAGSGSSTIGGTTFAWQQGDTFCIPSWMPYVHEAAEPSYLFRMDDKPLLTAIGAYWDTDPRG
jgi:gentisate 1,2-dioxygenase